MNKSAKVVLGRVPIKSRSTIWIINVRFGPLCGLKSDISRGPRSADCVVKVQNYRVMIFWLEDDPTDERQSV
jgi:hypothetical protein